MSQPARNSINSDDEGSSEETLRPPPLSAGVSQFVEDMGMVMERYGLPRIGGRIMGLFMIDEEPLSLDDIARLLGVSRASVSTNLRMSEIIGMAKRVSRPGDRRDYYIGTEDMWMQGIKSSKQNSILQIADAARRALPKVPPEDFVARHKLQEVIDFTDFFEAYLDRMLEEWEAYKAKKHAERNSQVKEDQD
jgi:DNA-binding transcriptional regulator GbsR (MarR family)